MANRKGGRDEGFGLKKMKTQDNESTSKNRVGSGSWSSSNQARRKICGCGKDVVLYTTKKGKNIGKLFWRCPDWKVFVEILLFVGCNNESRGTKCCISL